MMNTDKTDNVQKYRQYNVLHKGMSFMQEVIKWKY